MTSYKNKNSRKTYKLQLRRLFIKWRTQYYRT
nr:MAG TPA: hypothetical protein [Caudoviricetes sp.]